MKIREKKNFTDRSEKPQVLISVPKRIVRLATARNRLKRMIREAVREDIFFKDRQKIYCLYVLKNIERLKTQDVRKSLEALK